MSYNGFGVFQINTSGQPVVAGTVITASAFNALTADLATGLTTAITKDGQTATTAQIPFAAGLRSTLTTDSTTSTSGSIITDGGLGVAKAITAGSTITGTKLIPTGTSVTGNGMYLPAANTLGFSTNGTNAITINSSQNVGIGTSSPTSYSSKFIEVSNATSAGLKLTAGTSGLGLGADISYLASDKSLRLGTYEATGYIQFRTQDTERAQIDSSGNLLVGTTSVPSAGSGGSAFYVDSNSRRGLAMSTSSTSANTLAYFANPNGTVGSISTSGSATLYNVTSDQRLKENIQDSESASSLIDSLQVRQYDWKSDGLHQRYGFIAQELVAVAPEAVYQPEDTGQMMAVDYSKLVPMLVKAHQEQQALITTLTERITALENA